METYFSHLNDDILGLILLYLPNIPEIISEILSDNFSWNLLVKQRYPFLKDVIEMVSLGRRKTIYQPNGTLYTILLSFEESESYSVFAEVIMYNIKIEPLLILNSSVAVMLNELKSIPIAFEIVNDIILYSNTLPYKPWNWNWDYISKNPSLTWEIIRDNPDKPWNLGAV
jgi:hypothetical protein